MKNENFENIFAIKIIIVIAILDFVIIDRIIIFT